MELLLSFITGLFLGLIIGFYKISNFISNPKTKGIWGEMLLERILEASGMQKGVHYTCQESFKGKEKEILRPDVIINLPGNRQVVIDSKVCLDKKSAKDHIKSLRNKFYEHIKELNTPDFVIMFIPAESVYINLMSNDILEYAWNNKILLTGPSTLLATLKTIYLSWQYDSQSRNVLEIAEESGKLYDKFVGIMADFEAVKTRLENIDTKLEGRGGIIHLAEKIKSMGAKTSKQLSDKYLK